MNTMSSMFPHSMPPYNYQPYYQSSMPVPLPAAAPGPEPLRPLNYQQTMHVSQPAANPGPEHLRPSTCYLQVRQQPIEALVTVKGKEKFRKPLDDGLSAPDVVVFVMGSEYIGDGVGTWVC